MKRVFYPNGGWGVATSYSESRTAVFRAAPMAGPGYISERGIDIEIAKRINGSGEQAFGGARSWPYLRMYVDFPAGGEAQRAAFLEKLKAFIDKELPPPTEPRREYCSHDNVPGTYCCVCAGGQGYKRRPQ